MPAKNENSNTRRRYLAVSIAFLTTCLVLAAILAVAVWILRDRAGIVDWRLQWNDAVMLGTLATIWRIWLRNRN